MRNEGTRVPDARQSETAGNLRMNWARKLRRQAMAITWIRKQPSVQCVKLRASHIGIVVSWLLSGTSLRLDLAALVLEQLAQPFTIIIIIVTGPFRPCP